MKKDLSNYLEMGKTFYEFAYTLKMEAEALGFDDINHSQLLFLVSLGENKKTMKQCMDDRTYCGSNGDYLTSNLILDGYLEKSDMKDKRKKKLLLTPKGIDLYNKLKEFVKEME